MICLHFINWSLSHSNNVNTTCNHAMGVCKASLTACPHGWLLKEKKSDFIGTYNRKVTFNVNIDMILIQEQLDEVNKRQREVTARLSAGLEEINKQLKPIHQEAKESLLGEKKETRTAQVCSRQISVSCAKANCLLRDKSPYLYFGISERLVVI